MSLKPSTLATYKSNVKHHIRPRWDRVALADVAHEDVVEWIGGLHQGGLSASRTRQVHTIFAPKTHAVRTISVPRTVADALTVELAGKAADDFVFTSPRGDVLREGNWRRDVFDAAATRIGQPGLTPHALRHTGASLAISAGVHVVAVSRLLGHASPNVTLGVYSHLLPNELERRTG